MTEHLTPSAEATIQDESRLAKLRQLALLDSPAELAFDRLTRLASALAGAPVALVSLVDDHRQFFKSSVGLPEPWASLRETPLSHSFCQHVVATAQPLIIHDAREHPLVCENLAVRDLNVRAYLGHPIITSDNQTLGSFCVIDTKPRQWTESEMEVMKDLTASVITEIELRAELIRSAELSAEAIEARATAERANLAKSAFLARMSHEIRTPINGILGMMEVVLGAPLTDEQRQNLSLVQSSSKHLLAIVNDILDISKVEAGKLELESVPLDMSELVATAVTPLAPRAEEKGVELIVSIDPRVPTRLLGDPTRCAQILINLVGNAIKFTAQGEVYVAVDLDRTFQDQVVLHGTVRDTGMGIPPKKLDGIFQVFTQADVSTTRQFGGTGLGLSICKQLVELMGGRIWAENHPDGGAIFHFTVQLTRAAEVDTSQTVQTQSRLEGLRALVVDDNAMVQAHICAMLTSWGMHTTPAGSSAQALAVLASAEQAKKSYDLLCLETDLHGGHGLELLSQLRRLMVRHPRVLLISPSVLRPGHAKREQDLTYDARISKPIMARRLQDTLIGMLDESHRPSSDLGPVRVTAEQPMQPGLRILLVEDNRVNQLLATRHLSGMGHQVVIANHGQEGLDALERQAFDLVFMDVHMPIMDGLQATGAIRDRERQIADGNSAVPAESTYAIWRDLNRPLPICCNDGTGHGWRP
ncbi:MAG: ATP-binding protein [Chloroflexota bacterium]